MGTISQPYTRVQPLPGGPCTLWKTHWGVNESVSPTTSGFIENSPFRVDSGSFEISTDTINGRTAKTIDFGSTGMCNCPTTYLHQTPTEAALGEWEIWFKKTSDASVFSFMFIASNDKSRLDAGQNGYGVAVLGNDSVSLLRVDSGVTAVVDTGTIISLNTWYKINVIKVVNDISIYLNDVLDVGPITDATYDVANYINLQVTTAGGNCVSYSDIAGGHAIAKRI